MATKRKTITAHPLVRFLEVIGGCERICVSVGPDLSPVILTLASEPDYRMTKSGIGLPKKYADHANDFTIHYQTAHEWHEIRLPETRENYHYVQPIGNDLWLVVRGRSEGDDDSNAHIFDADGRPIRSFPAGDGIQDVQTDEAGNIWISYFDEGVFGKTKLGNSGLVCVNDRGQLVFDFRILEHECVSLMADCYAMNVCSSQETWLCYYMDFPLVKLSDFKLAQVWPEFPVAGSPAFAIAGDRTLWAGGYEKKNTLVAVTLGSLRKRVLQPIDGQGRPVSTFSPFGRKSSLFLATAEQLFVIDLRDGAFS